MDNDPVVINHPHALAAKGDDRIQEITADLTDPPAVLAAIGTTGLVDWGPAGLREDDIRTPYRGRNKPASQKDANRAHARLRAPGERANAQLKSWRILRRLRCCPWRAGQLAKAVHVLQTREIEG